MAVGDQFPPQLTVIRRFLFGTTRLLHGTNVQCLFLDVLFDVMRV